MIFFTSLIVKCMEKNLNIMKPRYSEQILPVPWPFTISRFHCIELIIHVLPLWHTFASSKYGKKSLGRTKSFSSRLLIHGKLG